tara:strand:+ start:49 stop:348 length:300 start_codon:yes stop_codon:yes gene_type:complete
MIKAFLVLISVTLLTACGVEYEHKYTRKVGELQATRYLVRGISIDCVSANNTYHTLSCNWEKYNKIINECKSENLSERTVITKDGETLVFPATKGECGD